MPIRAIITAAAVALFAATSSHSQTVRGEIEDIVRDYLAKHPEEIERIVKDYLAKHPEVLQESLVELLKKRPPAAASASADKTAAVKSNATALFNSTHQVTLGNPHGDVTMVEFFDFNCIYCKRALGDMLDLLKNDPKLKVVLKEFPVLGQASVEAARVAIAVRMQDQTGKKYIEFHEKLLGGRGPADKASALAVAKEIGLDLARLVLDLESDEIKLTLEESSKLARALGLNGTPSYVIGENVVIGAVGIAALRDKIQAARK